MDGRWMDGRWMDGRMDLNSNNSEDPNSNNSEDNPKNHMDIGQPRQYFQHWTHWTLGGFRKNQKIFWILLI